MRLYQLLESDKDDYQLMYDTLLKDCSKFYQISNGFKYVPHRSDSIKNSSENLFQMLYKYKTRPTRTSIVSNFSNNEIIPTFDMISKAHGNASRIEHMVTSSSLGENSSFPVSEYDNLIFPIGDFTYSYIDDDFNNHTDDLSLGLSQAIKRLTTHPKWKSEKQKILTDDKLMRKYFFEILDNIELNDDSKKIIANDFIKSITPVYEILELIKNDDYTYAFNDENEIWFNCKSYYSLSTIDYKYMMRNIQGDT